MNTINSPTATNLARGTIIELAQNVYNNALAAKEEADRAQSIVDGKLDAVYPVGSVYISVSETSPASLFGGNWERISQGRVLVGAGTAIAENSDNAFGSLNNADFGFVAGSTGGQFRDKMAQSQLPITIVRYAENSSGSPKTVTALTSNSITIPDGDYAWMDGAWEATMNDQDDEQTYNNNMQPYLVVNMWKRIP